MTIVDFLLFGQQPNLNRWLARPFSTGAKRGRTAKSAQDVYERVVAEEGPGVPADAGPHSRVAAAILRYDVFPRRILRPELSHEPIGLGDVVGGVSPFAPGIRIFFASRVVDRFDGELNGVWRTGFTYRTLQGHPEHGEETFSVDKDVATGVVRVRLSSWSQPGNWFTRAFASRARRVQVYANKRALDRLEHVAASGASAGQV
jgi:uncharacterized protein (UPF0548 family)